MAELVYAYDSKSYGSNPVWVRVPPAAQGLEKKEKQRPVKKQAFFIKGGQRIHYAELRRMSQTNEGGNAFGKLVLIIPITKIKNSY